MANLLEVREFDLITCNEDFKMDKNYHYLSPKRFNELKDFIYGVVNNEEDTSILDFLKVRSQRHVGEIISVNNYVGLIQLKSGYQIQILPKISFDYDDCSSVETKRIFIKMLRSMKDFPSKIFNEAHLKIDKMNLYEIFISMYLQEVRNLIKRGLKSSYLKQEYNLKYYKGKLVLGEHIKRNIAHKERFYVAYDEYHVNRVENRLIKSTLLQLLKQSKSNENVKEIRQLLTFFEMIQPSTNYEKDFSKVVIDRKTKDYEMLMGWSKVFLLNRSFTTFSGSTTNKALLFPMEKVFESYVAKQFKQLFSDLNWKVSSQHKGYYLFDNPQQFALRPDIVIDCKNGRRIIMDTKWKRLVANIRSNYGISQSDMYQMYAYAKKYQTSEIWLLYPLNDEIRDHEPIIFESNDDVKIQIYFIDLANIEKSMYELKQKLMNNSNIKEDISK